MSEHPEELGPEARAILDATRGADDPDSARIARVRRGVTRQLGLAAGGAMALAATKAAASTMVLKIFAALAIVAVAAGGVAVATRASKSAAPIAAPSASPSASPAPTPNVAEPVAPIASAPSSVMSSAPPPRPIAPPTPTPSASSAISNTLAAERALLASAQQAISESRFRAALDLYEKYSAEYPFGQLSLEASVGRVVALCGMHRSDAKAEAARVLARNPPPGLASRIRNACALDTGP